LGGDFCSSFFAPSIESFVSFLELGNWWVRVEFYMYALDQQFSKIKDGSQP
jgi:hypothetical protein